MNKSWRRDNFSKVTLNFKVFQAVKTSACRNGFTQIWAFLLKRCAFSCVTVIKFDQNPMQWPNWPHTFLKKCSYFNKKTLRQVLIFTAWKALKFRVIFDKLSLLQFSFNHFELLIQSILIYLPCSCGVSKNLTINLHRYNCSKKSHFLCLTVYISLYSRTLNVFTLQI